MFGIVDRTQRERLNADALIDEVQDFEVKGQRKDPTHIGTMQGANHQDSSSLKQLKLK